MLFRSRTPPERSFIVPELFFYEVISAITKADKGAMNPSGQYVRVKDREENQAPALAEASAGGGEDADQF